MSEDLQSLIEALEISARAKCSYMLGVKDVEMLVERLGSQVAENSRLRECAVNGWISVKDRLPREGERALVLSCSGVVYIAYHLEGIRQWTTDDGLYFHGSSYGNFIFWQPLPNPPESETP